MKKIGLKAVLASVMILFSACSDNGGAHFGDAEQLISVVGCVTTTPVTATDIAGYTTMISGDTLIEDVNNTVVTTYHDVNGTKKVCVVSGKAYLSRK